MSRRPFVQLYPDPDWGRVRELAESMPAADIRRAVGYGGSTQTLVNKAARRGIALRSLTPQAAALRSRGIDVPEPPTKPAKVTEIRRLHVDTRQPPQYPQQVTVAPFQVRDSEPDRGGRPMFTDRTADAIAGMRARGASDREIAQALRLTPAQASAYGLRTVRASDPFGTDPRNKAKESPSKK